MAFVGEEAKCTTDQKEHKSSFVQKHLDYSQDIWANIM